MSIKPKDFGEIKQNVKNYHNCPYCKEKIEIGIESNILEELHKNQKFPYPHVHIHGNPLHAMLCYIDKNLKIRSKGIIHSIEISRDSITFSLLVKKWSNPY
jgi:hypothetical protein